MATTSSEPCPGCGDPRHGLAGCPFEVPSGKASNAEVLGVLVGRYPVRTMPIAMKPEDEPDEQPQEGD